MAKMLRRVKRTLSVLLAAAMVVTAVPQTGVSVYAAETGNVLDESSEAAGSSIAYESYDTVDQGAAEAGDENDSSELTPSGEMQQDENNSEDEAGSKESQPGESASDQPQDGDNASSDQTSDGDEVNADETQDGDGTDAEEQEPGGETVADADESLTDEGEELDETAAQADATEEEPGDGQEEEAKKINVNITLPYYSENGYVPYLAEFSYAIGEGEEYTSVDMEKKADWNGKYTVSIPVEVDTNLRFKLSCKDNTRLKDVTWKSKYPGYNNYSPSVHIPETDGVYTIEVKETNDYSWETVESYEIDISVVQLWTVTFVDLYARNHNGTPSVEVYQNKESGDGEADPVDIIGQTITVDSEEWNKTSCYYKVKAKEGFMFDSMAAAVPGITVESAAYWGGTDAYRLVRGDGAPKDITIFVTADETQEKKITLNMPSEVTSAMDVAVYGKTPSQEKYTELELTDGTVKVQDDMKVYVLVTSNNMAYIVQATYQEKGGEPESFAESDMDMSVGYNDWTREFRLSDLNYVNEEITINLSRVKLHKVRMAVNWEAVRGITVSTPVYGWYSHGEDESGAITIYVPEREKLKFYVEMEENKGVAYVSGEDGKEIGIAGYDKDSWGNPYPYYSIIPTSDMAISVKGREYEYRFDYSEDDFSILVYEEDRNNDPSGESLELTDYCYRTYRNDRYLWVFVKPKTGKEFSVWYNRGGGREDAEYKWYNDKTEEDGSKYFCYGPIDESWTADNTITIEGYNTNTVTFKTEDNLSFRKMTYEPEGDYFSEEEWIDGSITVREGEDLYFRVRNYSSSTHRLRISMTGTDSGSLESRWDDEDMKNYLVYHLVPTADTTITVSVEERKPCEVVIGKSDNVKSFSAWYDDDGIWDEIEEGKTYTAREDGYIIISDVTANGSDAAAKKGKVVYQIGEESYEVLQEYDLEGDQEPIYRIKVTDSMKISVDVQDVAQYTLSFKNFDQLENIRVWKLGTCKEKDNLYKTSDGSVTLDDNGYYYFDFQLTDGVGLNSVALKDSAGNEKILTRTCLEEADWEMGYRIGIPRGNMEVVPELVSGYTVKFDLSKLSAEEAAAVKIHDSYRKDELIIGREDGQDIRRKLSAAAAESSSFYLKDWDHYKLTPDSELFTLTKALQADDWKEDYACVISPKQTTGLPKVVTISLEKYKEHTVTLDYSDVIRSISLRDTYGTRFKLVENETKVYKVYGEGAVLCAKAIDGYSPVVKMKGTAEGAQVEELPPYRLDAAGGSEYYLGELNEDKIIQVTVTRSTQRKTYYKVGFLSEGGQVTVRDALYGTLYDINSSEDYYSADYSVLKGDKISFYAEPAFGFELKGVYANGQKVQPVRDTASQRNIYEVTPAADTQIRIDVSKIVPKYPLTFSWTNTEAVKAVNVRGYELQNNRIDVGAGEKISFSVELTDTKYSVTSVKMNGREVPYSAGDGSYTLTALEEPMNVEINADVADKVVRFSNTLENAKYEVETNELIRLRNDNTYLASGNAELLKFKVTVSDKEQKVGVTYINQKGLKSVLKEKEQTDQGEQGLSYSYEIAVAELPLSTEITIGGEIPAGDKTALEKAVAQYKDYKKSDYTEDSWSAFEKALKEAQDCMKQEQATQEEIDAALGKLTGAAAALVKKGEQPGIDPIAREGLWIKEIENQTYNGSAFKPEVEVYNGSERLTIKKDYTVSYKNNTNAGIATVTVNGKGNYNAQDKVEFEILKKNINDEDVTVSDVYAVIKANGTVVDPKVAVKFGKKTLKNGTDYKVVYPELKKDADGKVVPQSCEITITTTESANYTGTRAIRYDVISSDTLLMSKAKVTLSANKVAYKGMDGKETEKPTVEVKIGSAVVPGGPEGAYDVEYDNWNQVGKATVTVTAKQEKGSDGAEYYGKYYGSKSVTYTVEGTKLSAGQLDITGIEPQGYVYTGKPIFISGLLVKTKGADVKTLAEGTDYTVSYKTGKTEGAHTDAGTVSLTITGIGGYTGTVKKTFKITPFDLADYSKDGTDLQFAAEGNEKAKYTKTGAKPAFTLAFNKGDGAEELMEKTDYTVSYAGNTKIKAGEKSATMTIKGKGNFKGSISYKYEVTAASADDVMAVAADIAKPDQFNKLKTTVKVIEKETGKVLKAGTDYDKNIAYYIDEACQTQVTADNFDQLKVDSKVYAKIILKEGGSYVAANTTPGQLVGVYRLYDNSMIISVGSKFDVKVSTDATADGINRDQNGNPLYTGKSLEPKVVVTRKDGNVLLTEGVDYEVTYSNNINKGKATATVTAIGNGYGGSKSVKFTIVSAPMSWAEQAGKVTKQVEEASEQMLNFFSGWSPIAE